MNIHIVVKKKITGKLLKFASFVVGVTTNEIQFYVSCGRGMNEPLQRDQNRRLQTPAHGGQKICQLFFFFTTDVLPDPTWSQTCSI